MAHFLIRVNGSPTYRRVCRQCRSAQALIARQAREEQRAKDGGAEPPSPHGAVRIYSDEACERLREVISTEELRKLPSPHQPQGRGKGGVRRKPRTREEADGG